MNTRTPQVAPGPLYLHFEGIGTITLPGAQTLAFLGGLGILAVAGMIEWPVAVLFLIARLLAGQTQSAALRGLSDALALAR